MMSRLGRNVCCFSTDLSVKYFKDLGSIKNTFWRKHLSCWLDNKQKWSTETPAKIALEKQCLWNNSNISYRKQTLFFETGLIQASLLFLPSSRNCRPSSVIHSTVMHLTHRWPQNSLCAPRAHRQLQSCPLSGLEENLTVVLSIVWSGRET